MDCQSPNPNFSEFAFLVNRSADYELWISIFKAIDELVCYKIPNLLFYFYVLRSGGWNLTIMGGQPKMPIVASIVYAWNSPVKEKQKNKKK
jgi:hypothetical protein